MVESPFKYDFAGFFIPKKEVKELIFFEVVVEHVLFGGLILGLQASLEVSIEVDSDGVLLVLGVVHEQLLYNLHQ